MVELHLFVELVNDLLIVGGDVGVAVTQVVEDVAEVSAVAIDEITPLLVLRHIVPARKHS